MRTVEIKDVRLTVTANGETIYSCREETAAALLMSAQNADFLAEGKKELGTPVSEINVALFLALADAIRSQGGAYAPRFLAGGAIHILRRSLGLGKVKTFQVESKVPS